MRTRQRKLCIRLTEEEKTKLNELKEKTGFTYARVIRMMILNGNRTMVFRSRPSDYAPKIIRELNAIGNNLNQILRIAVINNVDTEEIKDTVKTVEHLSKEICNL